MHVNREQDAAAVVDFPKSGHSLPRCGSGSWGGRCLSLGDYVTGMGPQEGRPLAEGASVAYAHAVKVDDSSKTICLR